MEESSESSSAGSVGSSEMMGSSESSRPKKEHGKAIARTRRVKTLNVKTAPQAQTAQPTRRLSSGFDTRDLLLGLLAGALILILVYNAAVMQRISAALRPQISQAIDESKPSAISLVSIVDSNCPKCFDISKTVSAVKATRVQVLSEKSVEFSSAEGKALVKQYEITKIPAIVVTGELNRSAGFESSMQKKGEALIFAAPTAPYTDPASGEVKGLVKVTIIENKACTRCFAIAVLAGQLEKNGVAIAKQETLDYHENAAQGLISQLGITILPAMILSRDLEDYPVIAQQLASIPGATRIQGSYVVQSPSPPFYDLASQGVVGVVALTLLTDDACTGCYNVTLHRKSLARFGIAVGSEVTVDAGSAEGKALIAKYNITNVPTILMSKDAKLYPALMTAVWPQVGVVADDGTLVFTRTSVMGAYMDLKTGKLVAPQPEGNQGG